MMLGESKQLYHCQNCGAVFRSVVKDISELRCSECGESPVRSGFSDLPQLSVDVEAPSTSVGDQKHSVDGKVHTRRRFSRRKIKKKSKKGRNVMFIMIALTVLVSIFGYSYYKNPIENEEIVAQHDHAEKLERQRKKASVACLERFLKFVKSNGYGEMSEHVCNRNDHLRRMQQYYSNILNRERIRNGELGIKGSKLSEVDSVPKLDALIAWDFSGNASRISEAVFWKVDGDWLLDWAHYVRSGDLDWSVYLKDNTISGEKEFRLYARERNTESEVDRANGYKEIVLTEALNKKNGALGISRAVYVERGTETEIALVEAIRKKQASSDDVILGKIDDTKQARVRVKIAYEQVKGQDGLALVVKELVADHWLSEVKE